MRNAESSYVSNGSTHQYIRKLNELLKSGRWNLVTWRRSQKVNPWGLHLALSFLLGLLGFLSTVLSVTPFLPWWMEPSEMNKTNLASRKLLLSGVWWQWWRKVLLTAMIWGAMGIEMSAGDQSPQTWIVSGHDITDTSRGAHYDSPGLFPVLSSYRSISATPETLAHTVCRIPVILTAHNCFY